jgi:tRNA-specific 2-thiouridylase
VPDNDYRRFLRERVDDMDEKAGPGPFVLSDGSRVGTHEGYPFYTIGQRHGLGLAMGEPIYVTDIDPETNVITVGPRNELLRHALTAVQVNHVREADLSAERSATAKIRYNDPGAGCLVWEEDGALRVVFDRPRRAITPGQAVVVYDGADVLAGAWIDRAGRSAARPVGRETNAVESV